MKRISTRLGPLAFVVLACGEYAALAQDAAPSSGVVDNRSWELVDQQIQLVWSEFCALLRAGDVESAMQYFIEGDSRERYSEVFRNMGTAVRQWPESLSEIQMIDEFGNFARYVVVRTKDGERRMHEVLFVQGQDAKWFLSSL
jgi:hypothetical protein